MSGIRGNESAQGFDRGVLITVGPLHLRHQDPGAAGGRGVRILLHQRFQLGHGFGLGKHLPGGLLRAFLDPANHDERGGSRDEQDREGDHPLLVAVEEGLECGGSVGDFGEWP